MGITGIWLQPSQASGTLANAHQSNIPRKEQYFPGRKARYLLYAFPHELLPIGWFIIPLMATLPTSL